jgi:hypothetical protein
LSIGGYDIRSKSWLGESGNCDSARRVPITVEKSAYHYLSQGETFSRKWLSSGGMSNSVGSITAAASDSEPTVNTCGILPMTCCRLFCGRLSRLPAFRLRNDRLLTLRRPTLSTNGAPIRDVLFEAAVCLCAQKVKQNAKNTVITWYAPPHHVPI